MFKNHLAKFLNPLAKILLERSLSKACPMRIPRSGESGAQVDCYTVAIDRDGEPYLLVNGLSGDCLSCSEWDGSSYSQGRKINFSETSSKDFRITHYYGLAEVNYFGLGDFVRGHILNIPYVKIHSHQFLSVLDQYFFNKKKLITKQRMELLRFLIDQTLDGKNSFELIDLMIKLYTDRWLLHPEGDDQTEKVKLYLNSLIETGELKEVDHQYILTGLALRTMEEYEEQERKHVEQIKLQRGTLGLTVVIAFLTLVQSGLIKLPALIDFSVVGHTVVIGK